jgi:hypothetical protein
MSLYMITLVLCIFIFWNKHLYIFKPPEPPLLHWLGEQPPWESVWDPGNWLWLGHRPGTPIYMEESVGYSAKGNRGHILLGIATQILQRGANCVNMSGRLKQRPECPEHTGSLTASASTCHHHQALPLTAFYILRAAQDIWWKHNHCLGTSHIQVHTDLCIPVVEVGINQAVHGRGWCEQCKDSSYIFCTAVEHMGRNSVQQQSQESACHIRKEGQGSPCKQPFLVWPAWISERKWLTPLFYHPHPHTQPPPSKQAWGKTVCFLLSKKEMLTVLYYCCLSL